MKMRHHDEKASWGGKGLFGLRFHVAAPHQRKSGQEREQGRHLEAGADVEVMEGWAGADVEVMEGCCFPWLAQHSFS